MKKFLLSAMLTGAAFAGHAQRFLTEVFPSVQRTNGVVYANNFTVISGTPQAINLTMDIYEPAGATDTMARRPLIILLHSGTFLPPYLNTQLDGGRNDSGLVFIANSFARRGYVVANIDYRLGWVPQGNTIDIRRGTLINAFVRAIQDTRACIRYFRKDAGTTNTYRIDSSRVIIGGPATGGALAVNTAVLRSQAQLNILKFISGSTVPQFGFVTGQSYVNPAVIGDLDGYGGNPMVNNPNNSPGYGSLPNFVFAFEAIVGDSTWIVPGLPPMVSMHRANLSTNTQPYGNGTVFVNVGGPQPVVDVSGSGVFIPKHNANGNNACFAPNNFTDPYTQKAMQLSGGVEGLYPVQANNANITWYDSTSSVTECQAFGVPLASCNAIYASYAAVNNKTQNLRYIDTFMNYLNPRIVECLYTRAAGVKDVVMSQGALEVYPNPTAGSVTISSTVAGNRLVSVTVQDLTGKTVQHRPVAHTAKTDLSLGSIAPGLYLLRVETEAGVAVQRLVIQR